MVRSKLFVITLVIFLLISSCSNVATKTDSNIKPTNTVEVNTDTPVSTLALIQTVEARSPTTLPQINTQCADNSKEASKINLPGLMIFHEPQKPDYLRFGFFLLDGRSGNVIKTVDGGSSPRVAPDGKHLVYLYSRLQDDFLRVLDNTGKTINDFPFHLDGKIQDYFNWQNAEQLRVLQQVDGWKVLVHALNPFTLEHVALRTDWDGVYTPKNPFLDKLVQWKFDRFIMSINSVYGANVLYDPTLTRVVYPKDNGVVALVNVETGAELAHANFTDWGRIPVWSLDGTYLTILNREGSVDNFYLVSRDGGEFQRLTDFGKEFNYVSVPDYALSPDGKKIAFWLSLQDDGGKEGGEAELALLDISSRQVTRLCIQGIGHPASKPWVVDSEPVWSPDGKYLLISQWDNPDAPKSFSVLALNLVSGSVANISKNTAPIGWMVSP